MDPTVRVRFAPSPTGHLHIGGARTALFNWLFAKHQGGAFVLRIEDTDVARSSDWSESSVLADLSWLGLDWDEGPDVGGGYGPYRQSERLEIYEKLASELIGQEKAFRCYCSDEELEVKRKKARAENRVPHYDGTCRHLTDKEREARETEGRRAAIRLKGPESEVVVSDMIRGEVRFHESMLGDFIVVRSNGMPTYNFACAVDDALMKITHVIRAEDHLPNTMRQMLVYEALDQEPPVFAHVSLIVASDRSKLSKRRGATSVQEFKEEGYLPDGLVNYIALLGWAPRDDKQVVTRDELVSEFELSRVSMSPAALDHDKLTWVNAQHIKMKELADLVDLVRPFAREGGILDDDDVRFTRMVELTRDRLKRLSDVKEELAIFFDSDLECEQEAAQWRDRQESRTLLAALSDELEAGDGALSREEFDAALKRVGKKVGAKGKDLFMPARAALTGRTHGPPLGEVADILGRSLCVGRLNSAVKGKGR